MPRLSLSFHRSLQLLTAHALLKGPKDTKIIRLVVDTGATTTIIPPQFALAIGCDPVRAKKHISIITASGVEYLPVMTIPVIECLGQCVKNLPVTCHTLPPQSTVDGLLGLDFLSHVPAFQRFHNEILSVGDIHLSSLATTR